MKSKLYRHLTVCGIMLAGLLLGWSGGATPLTVSFKPSTADPAVTQFDNVHYAVVDPAVTARGRLVLMLPGTGANPLMYKLFPQNAASLGFHALGLMYPNGDPINALSAQYAPLDPDAAGNARQEVIDGTDRVSFLSVDRTNCIENRLLKALQYLQAQNPTRGWGQYTSGDTLLWDKIVVCGHSQGGGMAAMLAKTRSTNRCVIFTDMDYWVAGNRPYNWMFASPQTPVHQWFLLTHERDQYLDFTEMQNSAAALGIDRYGVYVRIETATSPTFAGTHFLSTNLEPAPAAADSYHGCPVVDKAIPLQADGETPVFKPTWDYMLLSPTPPDVTWAPPADITYGAALSATQLNATADVAGTFAYTPAAGTVLAAGAGQTLSVTFTPSDSVNYTGITRTVNINVGKADQTIAFAAIADQVFGVAPWMLTATATSNLTVSFAVRSGPALLDGNQLTLTGVGTVTVRASQNGTDNWNAAAPVDRSFNVVAAGTTRLDFDFALSDHGFTPGFADLPADAGPPDFYAQDSGWQPRPENLGGAPALFITGNNHSDDLWMYWKKRLTGLDPGTAYNLVVEVEFASKYPTGSVGVGGSPGDSVVLKAGAVAWEPLAGVATDGWWRMNLDKDSGGNVAGGSDLFTLGTIAKPDDGFDSYVSVTRTNQGQPRTVTTGADGSLWLAFGTDSGFEATTALYYTRLTVWLSRDTRQLPVLTWASPADITYGTALSATQLSATANVPGTFVYTPAPGTVLLAGDNQPLNVIFHPDDMVNYTDATTSVTINCLFNLHLTCGWNLISLPLEPRNPQVASVFSVTPGMIWASSIYAWQEDHYESASELHVQRGYWLYAFEDVDVTLAGAPASGRVTLHAGWNLLGPNGRVNASALAAPLGQAPAWSWDDCYRTATELQPGAGYWLYAPVPASDYRLGP